MPRAFVCDFDGTVTPADTGASMVQRFLRADAQPELEQALARWRAGAMGHRELTELECRLMEMTADEAQAFTRRAEVDPEFAPFVRWARARGDEVEIVSEGYEFYIAAALERAGLSDVPWAANRLRFDGRQPRPEFPHEARSCGRCGNCKGAHVRAQRARGREVVFVGDGMSDRCGAAAADRVFARAALWTWCRDSGLAAERFEGFADLMRRYDTEAIAGAGDAEHPGPAPRAGGGA